MNAISDQGAFAHHSAPRVHQMLCAYGFTASIADRILSDARQADNRGPMFVIWLARVAYRKAKRDPVLRRRQSDNLITFN